MTPQPHSPRTQSPLTRGKHSLTAPNAPPGGLIPAHAGKTHLRPPKPDRRRAHPRSRGENAQCVDDVGVFTGSSPFTRGKPFCGLSVRACARLIPAHAGKTNRASRPCCPPSAHPRSRGENGTASRPRYRARGSSPLTRGKREDSLAPAALGRLIPAHAGKTQPYRPCPCPSRAHPRSRGENRVWGRGPQD